MLSLAWAVLTPHAIDGKPQVSIGFKAQRSDIQQSAHTIPDQDPGANNSETLAVMGRFK
jgi:hypothetical protein